MKTLALIVALTASLFNLSTTGDAAYSWDKTTHDFGTIVHNEPASVEFELENLSSEPIIITRVKGSCGCTATSYQEEPIAPGETGLVKATYNAKSMGQFSKTVSVYTNFQDEAFVLSVSGEVVGE